MQKFSARRVSGHRFSIFGLDGGRVIRGVWGKHDVPEMIDIYYWPIPSGKKVTVFLEETGLEYKIIPVNIRKGEQFKPEFERR